MDNVLYISMAGAVEIMQAQTIHANNLANVSTHGFQADLAQARAMQVYGDGLPARVYVGTESPATNLSPGSLSETGRSLDIGISGQGYLAVQLADGSEAYTRAGDLHVDSLGQLLTGSGHLVLGDGGPIALPAFESVLIGNDGTITVLPQGQTADNLVVINRLKLVKPELGTLSKGTDGLLHHISGLPLEPSADVLVVSGFLENSNVNAVYEMTEILALAREFEIQMRLMQAAEENDQAATELVTVN